MPLLEVHDLHKAYGSRPVLSGVSFSAEAGEVLTIMGSSGGGKSTLLKIIIGAMKPDRGQVFIDGLEITSASERRLDEARVKFGVLFQNPALLHSLTVAENVALPLVEHSRLSPDVVEIMVRMKLGQVGMSDFADYHPHMLSGGMQKRAGLARAIARDPQVVFYDEPTAGLDPVVGRAMAQLILDFSRALNIAAVVISHDVNLMLPISDRAMLLYDGKVAIAGTPAELRASADPLVRQFLAGGMEGPIPVVPPAEEFTRSLLAD